MNEERYILAELKRWAVGLIREKEFTSVYAKDVLAKIAELEADAVLGEEADMELPFQDVEAN